MFGLEDDREDWTEEDHHLSLLMNQAEAVAQKYVSKMLDSARKKGMPSGMMANALMREAVAFGFKNGWDIDGIGYFIEDLKGSGNSRFQERPDQFAHALTHMTGETTAYHL
jgi:hypothetical protein